MTMRVMKLETPGLKLASGDLPGVECFLDLHHVEAMVVVRRCTCQSIQDEEHHLCAFERISH
jgi:hypothetical protein